MMEKVMTAPARASRSWLPVLLLVLAAGQIVSPLLITNDFTVADRAGEPAIVPAGYAFAIWGLIEALAVGYAVWAFVTRRDAGVRERLAAPLAVVFAGFTLWIVAAAVEPVWTTLVVFLVMFGGLLRALTVAAGARAEIARWSRLGRGLLWGMLGTYTGWTSIAVWLNLATALTGSGAPIEGTPGVLGQLAVLAGATATACAIVWWTGGLLPYAATTAWAFVGAFIGASAAGEGVLATATVVGLLVVAAVTLARRVGPAARVPVRPAT